MKWLLDPFSPNMNDLIVSPARVFFIFVVFSVVDLCFLVDMSLDFVGDVVLFSVLESLILREWCSLT